MTYPSGKTTPPPVNQSGSALHRALAAWRTGLLMAFIGVSCVGLGWMLGAVTSTADPEMLRSFLTGSAVLLAFVVFPILCLLESVGLVSFLAPARQSIVKDVHDNREINAQEGHIPPPFL